MTATNYMVPSVVEQTNRGERAYDLFSKLLKENIVFLGTPIDDTIANIAPAMARHQNRSPYWDAGTGRAGSGVATVKTGGTRGNTIQHNGRQTPRFSAA